MCCKSETANNGKFQRPKHISWMILLEYTAIMQSFWLEMYPPVEAHWWIFAEPPYSCSGVMPEDTHIWQQHGKQQNMILGGMFFIQLLCSVFQKFVENMQHRLILISSSKDPTINHQALLQRDRMMCLFCSGERKAMELFEMLLRLTSKRATTLATRST